MIEIFKKRITQYPDVPFLNNVHGININFITKYNYCIAYSSFLIMKNQKRQ